MKSWYIWPSHTNTSIRTTDMLARIHSRLSLVSSSRHNVALFSSAPRGDVGSGDGNTPLYHASSQQQQNRPRTRRRTIQSLKDGGKEVPSLADFMHRAKVRTQYRKFVRLATYLDVGGHNASSSSGECRAALEEVRLSYKMGMKKANDALSKSMAYSEVSCCSSGLLGQLVLLCSLNQHYYLSCDDQTDQ